ncbi:MAG: hypothetical protein FWE06_04355 [Oscillospiraceae bacterium]|nr:hypothetical protein [Oscillospiraceae bacterium]
MEWSDYIVQAAQHSKNSAGHWFRYLRKDIDKCGTLFSEREIEALYHNEALTPFQRVSLKAAFEDGSPTRQHIINLNRKVDLDKIAKLRAKYESIDA